MNSRNLSFFPAAIAGFALFGFAGCATMTRDVVAVTPATQLATEVDPQEANFFYWMDQPAIGAIEFDNFDTLMQTCTQVTRDYLFKLARTDYRAGVVTSEPLVSAQAFEVWRPDLASIDGASESTIATHRRTLIFQIAKLPDGRFAAVPKVVVERQAVAEKRVTSVVLYRDTIASRRMNPRNLPRGTRESDEGILLPRRYWYAVGRDAALEKKVALTVSERLARVANAR